MEFRIQTSLNHEEQIEWERFLDRNPFRHNFQRLAWGRFQLVQTGRESLYLIGGERNQWRVIGQIFKRQWPWPFSSLANYDVSCGPVFVDLKDFEETIRFLDQWAAHNAVQLQVGPRWPLKYCKTLQESGRKLGFRSMSDPYAPIYEEETVLVDLRPPENEILMSFRYNTRYEIRKAQKAGVQVRFSNAPEDMKIFYGLHLQQRARLKAAPEEEVFFNRLQQHFLCDPANGLLTVAEYEGQPLAAAIHFRDGKLCRYYHGASNEVLRKKLDTSHLLHWEAMRYFKRMGCESYDFYGASASMPRDYPSYGTNVFKTGFTKHFVRYTPNFTKNYRPVLSSLYEFRYWLMRTVNRVSGRWFSIKNRLGITGRRPTRNERTSQGSRVPAPAGSVPER
jgi:hypothetical protein